MSEDLAHDAHLRAALRHAPDHALAPPSGLSQTILAAARQAHLPVRASVAPPPVLMRPAGGRPQSLRLQRLFAPRWAGAWAAGLVAALGLGLWLDLGIEPVLDRPEAVATRNSVQPQPPTSTEGARAPSTPGDAATDSARVAALTKVQPPAPAEPAPPTATADATMPAARQRADERPDALRKEVDQLSQRREAVAPRPAEKAARRAEATTAEAAVQGRVAAAPESKLSDPAVGAPAAAAAPPPAPTVAQANAPPPAAALELHQGAVPRDARKAELGEAVPAASPAFTLLRRAQGELAAGSVRWTWAAPGAATMAPFDDAAQAWLSRVVQLARGRWVDVHERGELLDALEVRWWRDGWPHATLRIEPEGLRWIEPNGRIRYAPLDAATLQRLRSF